MNWRNEALEKLKKYDAMRQAAENIPQEIDRISGELRTVPHSEQDRRMELAATKQELEIAMNQTNLWLSVVSRGLEALPPDEKLVLLWLYVRPSADSMSRLCQELCLEQSSIYRKRKIALERFTLALYGATDT